MAASTLNAVDIKRVLTCLQGSHLTVLGTSAFGSETVNDQPVIFYCSPQVPGLTIKSPTGVTAILNADVLNYLGDFVGNEWQSFTVSNTATIQSLQAQLATANARIVTLQDQVATANARIVTLQDQVATANARIVTLQDQVATLTENLTSTMAAVMDMNTWLQSWGATAALGGSAVVYKDGDIVDVPDISLP